VIQVFGNHQLKNCVAEELKPLIVKMVSLSFVTDARMGQSLGQ